MRYFIFRLAMIILFLRLAMYLLLFLHDYTPDYSACNATELILGKSYDECVVFVKN